MDDGHIKLLASYNAKVFSPFYLLLFAKLFLLHLLTAEAKSDVCMRMYVRTSYLAIGADEGTESILTFSSLIQLL